MTRRKVLYGITKSNWGGAQRYVHDLATNLPKAQFEALVVAGGTGSLFDKLHAVDIRTYNLPELGRDISLWGDLRSFLKLVKIIRRERPDILHLNSPKIAGLGALAGRLLGVPKIIFTNHGWAFHENRPVWQKLLIKFFHWLTALLVHQIISIYEVDEKLVRDWPGLRDKVTTIYNGIKPGQFMYRDDARAELSRRLPDLRHQRNQLWIGTIGELHPNKGYDLALPIIQELKKEHPHLAYVIIGDGELHADLIKLINDSRLAGTVYLAGRIEEAARLLKAFDLFLLTSRKEGLPYVLLETGDAAVPAAAPAIGGIGELIKTGQTGVLINPEDPVGAAAAISSLLGNNLEREIVGRNLENEVRKRFSTERMVSETIRLYNK